MLAEDATIQQLVLFKSFSKTLLDHKPRILNKASASIGSTQSLAGVEEPSLEFSCISTKELKILLRNTQRKRILNLKNFFFYRPINKMLTEQLPMPHLTTRPDES
jgi:hypothetical protein